MAKYKSKDLKAKTIDELKDQLKLQRKEQYNIKFTEINPQIPSEFVFFILSKFFTRSKIFIYYGKYYFWEQLFEQPTVVNLRELLIP